MSACPPKLAAQSDIVGSARTFATGKIIERRGTQMRRWRSRGSITSGIRGPPNSARQKDRLWREIKCFDDPQIGKFCLVIQLLNILGATSLMQLQRTWLITGVSSGFGREITHQLIKRGDRVVGTIRDTSKVADLLERYRETFQTEVLDVTDTAAIRDVVERSFAKLGRLDVIVSVNRIVATSLLGSIQLIRAVLPHLRAQESGGRIIQISPYGGQLAFPGNPKYHATKWGIEGFVESVAQEVVPFGIGMTIVEPRGARAEFRYGSAQVAKLVPATTERRHTVSCGCLMPKTA
jgi:NAD(P)-dependent dehydrogenase (short-subunit alcohol dehydrogenase family)